MKYQTLSLILIVNHFFLRWILRSLDLAERLDCHPTSRCRRRERRLLPLPMLLPASDLGVMLHKNRVA
jgi:hypothetical protein